MVYPEPRPALTDTDKTVSVPDNAKALADKWAARSLDPDVLAAIRFENFSINEPKP
jgi:hypothetical protein